MRRYHIWCWCKDGSNKDKPHGRRCRRQIGSLLAEVALAMLILIPFLGLSLNGLFGLMAYEILDSGCRDAARAAAQAQPDPIGNPANPADLAQQAATAAVAPHNFAMMTMTAKVIDYQFYMHDTESTSVGAGTNNFYLVDSSGNPIPPSQGPYVTVRATMKYKLPIPVLCASGAFFTTGPLTMEQIYTFPIVAPTSIPPLP